MRVIQKTLNHCIVKSDPSQESKKKSGVLLRETKMLSQMLKPNANFQGKNNIYRVQSSWMKDFFQGNRLMLSKRWHMSYPENQKHLSFSLTLHRCKLQEDHQSLEERTLFYQVGNNKYHQRNNKAIIFNSLLTLNDRNSDRGFYFRMTYGFILESIFSKTQCFYLINL